MKLSTAEIERYQRDGFLLFPGLFSPQEVSLLLDAVERVSRIEAEGIFREDDDGQAKSMFRLHEPYGPTLWVPNIHATFGR